MAGSVAGVLSSSGFGVHRNVRSLLLRLAMVLGFALLLELAVLASAEERLLPVAGPETLRENLLHSAQDAPQSVRPDRGRLERHGEFLVPFETSESRTKRSPLAHGSKEHGKARRKRHHTEETNLCHDSSSQTVIHNALASDRRVSVRLGNRQVATDMEFGDAVYLTITLVSTESYHISDGSQTVSGPLGGLGGLPCKSVTYFVIEKKINTTGDLHARYYVFLSGMVPHDYAGVFVYNSMTGMRLNESIDVIGYNADLVANHQRSAVWRIGWNMRLGSSSDVIFPPGGFEFKVVPHNSVTSHCTFQPASSITMSSGVGVGAGVQYFVTLAGDVHHNHSSFHPRLIWSPQPLNPTHQRINTQLYLMNAYRSVYPTSIFMPFANATVTLPYGTINMAVVPLQLGDCVTVQNNNETFNVVFQFLIRPVCVAVPVGRANDGLACYVNCYDPNDILAPPGLAEVFIFNGLSLKNGGAIDMLAWGGEQGQAPALLSVKRNSGLFDGRSVLLPVGLYMIKIVPNGTVTTRDEFHRARSLADVVHVNLASQISYYIALMGSDEEQDFPPTVVYHPHTPTGAPAVVSTRSSAGRPVSPLTCVVMLVSVLIGLAFTR